ncbi:MAG: transglutaminase domain-containing protein [Oscillospiraceae bacterium]
MAVTVTAAALLCSCTEIGTEPEALPEDAELTVITYATTEPPAFDAAENGNYIYEQLSDKEKQWYDELKAAAEGFSERVEYSGEIDADTAKKIFLAVYDQEPGLFWLDSVFYPPRESSQLLKYRVGREEAESMKSELQQVTDRLLSETEGLSDYEKLLYFHDYLVRSCTFSLEGENYTIYSALCKGYAQCEGYAFSFKYLCGLAGIDCITATGTNAGGETHAWNLVSLNGIWYNVDCTWDDPVLENGSPDFLRRYFMLVPDSDILGVTHFRDDTYFSYPKCYDGSRTYFAREGFYAKSASEGIEMLEEAAVQALSEGHKDAEVRFESESDYRSAMRTLFDFGDIKRLAAAALERAGLDSSDGVSGMVRFSNDELHIIHITFG